jgi:cation/acetate symporter
MPDAVAAIDWVALIRLVGLWVAAVFLVLRVVDWLFPRMRRGGEETVSPAGSLRPSRRIPQISVSQTAPAPAVPTSTIYSSAQRWRSNLRGITTLLLIWFGASFVPPIFAPWLNTITVFGGFPLGYYIGSQGALVVFLALIWVYAWRSGVLDRRFRASRPSVSVTHGSSLPVRRIAVTFTIFTVGFVLLVLLLGALESALGLPANGAGWVLLVVTIGLYAVIGIANRARSLDEYLVAGRNIPAFFNGMAIGADWMSAASFISMAGTLWLLGYEGLAYITGWTGGYVLLALLLAPYLRKFGQYTIPDFIATRYEGNRPRIVATVIAIIISFTYVTAQVTGIGIIMSRFLGVNYLAGVFIGLGAVLFCSYLGGMRAITWTQVAQCLVLLVAYLVPVTLLSLRSTGVPIPQIMYGEVLEKIAVLEQTQGIAKSYATPFNDWTPWNFLALMLCLMCGTAGLPHILMRFYTVPDVAAARKSVGWAMVFICLLYFTAPAYAAFSRWEILQNVVGRPVTGVPEWAANWAEAGLLTISDANADGILQFDELQIDPDLVVLATPEMAGLPHAIAALVAAGGLAAALSTADGLLLVIGAALSHDLYTRALNQGSSARNRLLFGRAMVFLAAVAAALVATRRLGIIVQLVAWAFSFAAATFFPALVLGIFWKRANGRGAVAGMIAGLAVTLAYMLLNLRDPSFNILGITNVAAGVFGIPVNVLVTVCVSLLTPPPRPETQAMVESLRQA